MTTKTKPYIIAFIGEKDVGKTSLFNHIRGKKFAVQPEQGSDYYSKTYQVQRQNVSIKWKDTVGTEQYKVLSVPYFKEASAVVFVYSVNDRKTQTQLSTINQEIDDYEESQANGYRRLRFVIGNKSDLTSRVPIKDVEGFCKAKKAVGEKPFSTSAKTGSNVKVAIDQIVEAVFNSAKHPPADDDVVDLEQKTPDTKSKSCSC